MTEVLPKPPVGAPCNGCGICCRALVCSTGSYTLGLVDTFGQRAPGPCPALVERPDGTAVCGLMLRPRDYAPGKGSAHDLRAAVLVMIGAGAGCDEHGDAPEDDAALKALQQRHLERHGRAGLQAAVRRWFGI